MRMRKAIADANVFLNLRQRGMSRDAANRDFEPGPERPAEVRRRLMQVSRPTSETVSLTIGKRKKNMQMLTWPDGTTSLVSLENGAPEHRPMSTPQPESESSLFVR